MMLMGREERKEESDESRVCEVAESMQLDKKFDGSRRYVDRKYLLEPLPLRMLSVQELEAVHRQCVLGCFARLIC
jgi:hypothetical protein